MRGQKHETRWEWEYDAAQEAVTELERQGGFKGAKPITSMLTKVMKSAPVRQDHEQPKVKFSPREAV